jgi:hypothetical protein
MIVDCGTLKSVSASALDIEQTTPLSYLSVLLKTRAVFCFEPLVAGRAYRNIADDFQCTWSKQ